LSIRGNQLAFYCGTTIPSPVVAGSGSMFVEFSSDYVVTMSGFSAIFADTSGRHSELAPLLVNKDYLWSRTCDWTIPPNDSQFGYL
jgi:hypothetical protein